MQWRIYIDLVKFWTPPGPIFFIFIQFSVKFGQIIGLEPFSPVCDILDPPMLWAMLVTSTMIQREHPPTPAPPTLPHPGFLVGMCSNPLGMGA